jgi:hypothetical protein
MIDIDLAADGSALNVEFAPSRAASLADGSESRDSQSASAVLQVVPQSFWPWMWLMKHSQAFSTVTKSSSACGTSIEAMVFTRFHTTSPRPHGYDSTFCPMIDSRTSDIVLHDRQRK